MRRLLLACIIAMTLFLVPIATFAYAADLSPAFSDLSKKFSEPKLRNETAETLKNELTGIYRKKSIN